MTEKPSDTKLKFKGIKYDVFCSVDADWHLYLILF